MTKTDYLSQLHRYLRKLPKDDYQEAMDYFIEYFHEAGPENEAQVIEELGSPKEAAHEVISHLLNEKIIADQPSLKNRTTIIWIALLAILASPLAIPLLIVCLALIFSMIIFFLSLILVICSFIGVLVITGLSLIFTSVPLLSTSLNASLLGIGIGLGCFGLFLLLLLLTIEACKGIIKLLTLFINWLIQKGKKS